jgi:hypothetical protein
MSSIFHYTDAAGLFGIISSETLYAADYRYLNDSSEGGQIRNYIMPIFETEIANITKRLVAKGFLKEKYYEELGTQGNSLEAGKMYGSFVRAVDTVSPFFVTSFCRHEPNSYEHEHGLLSQWRGYAESGGFAIEFDEDKLDALAKKEVTSFPYAGFKSENVSYFGHENLFEAADYTGVAGEMIRGIFEFLGKDVSEITGRKNIDEVVLKYAKTAPFLKHSSFHEEEEYRLVFVCFRANKIPEGMERPAKPIQVRRKGSLLVPFIELFGAEDMFAAVNAIIVGPHSFQDKQEEALKMFLESEGLSVSVRKSEIPYRQ